MQLASLLPELTYHMGSHGVTCHPAEVTFLPLPQPIRLVVVVEVPFAMSHIPIKLFLVLSRCWVYRTYTRMLILRQNSCKQ